MGHPNDRDSDPKSSSFFSSWLQPNDARQLECQQHRLPKQPEHDSAPPPDTNAFIKFKNFVDSNFAALADLPSNLADLQRRAANDWDDANVNQILWTGSLPSKISRDTFWSALSEQDREDAENALNLLLTTAKRNVCAPRSKWVDLYYDPEYEEELGYGPNLSVGGACYYRGEAGSNAAAGGYRWLSVGWFKRSPYSPVNLEVDAQLHKYDTKWRHAFEDLLEAALDKPMSSRERFGVRLMRELDDGYRGELARLGQVEPGLTKSTWRGPGLDWMLSLMCRGFLPPQLPSIYRAKDKAYFDRGLNAPGPNEKGFERDYEELLHEVATPDVIDHEMAITELDAYERQWARIGEAVRQEREMELGGCPDELGRAFAQAAREEREDSAGDCPDPLGRAMAQLAREEREDSSSGCSDPLGRAVAEAAREEREYSSGECPDPLGRAVAAAMREDSAESAGGCPDELGRAVAESAREERQYEAYRQHPDPTFEKPQAWEAKLRKLVNRRADHIAALRRQRDQGICPIEWRNIQMRIQKCDGEIEALMLRQRELDMEEGGAQHRWNYPEEYDDEDQDDEDLPGELWGSTRQMQEQLRHQERLLRASADSEQLVAQKVAHESRILDTLTDTHVVRDPDGTVTTTRILKTRFADGRESQHVSEHKSFEGVESAGTAAVGGGEEKEKKKGWFWS